MQQQHTTLHQATLDAIAACLAAANCAAAHSPIKWRIVQEKLTNLRAGLADAAAGDEAAEFLQSVLSSLRDVEALVRRCDDVGRLRLRSDLDIVARKLDAIMEQLDAVCPRGATAHHSALVVPKPAAGATREEMRFYIRDLLARLKAGGVSAEMRMQAITALSSALREDDKYASVLATDVEDDGIGILVGLLACRDDGIREEVIAAVLVIAGFDSYRGAVVLAGAIPSLIRALEDAGTASARLHAARCLKKLTENSANAWAVAAHGGVTALLSACRDVHTGEEFVSAALSVLHSLSAVEEIKAFMMDAGVVPLLANVAESSPVEATQVAALEFLAAIACDGGSSRQLALQEASVGTLVGILNPSAHHRSVKAREAALRAIDAICFSSASSMHRLIQSGFLDSIVAFLQHSGGRPMQQPVMKMLCRLTTMSDEIKKALGDAGLMPELLRMLEASTIDVREMAAEALRSMVTVQQNMKRLVQRDIGNNVGWMLQLLGHHELRPETRRFLLSVLSRVVESSSGRRKVASSEHIGCLQRLAESDGAAAKHIVKKIAGGRWRTMVNSILQLRR